MSDFIYQVQPGDTLSFKSCAICAEKRPRVAICSSRSRWATKAMEHGKD